MDTQVFVGPKLAYPDSLNNIYVWEVQSVSQSGVKEKCAGGQGKVRWGSRRSASAEFRGSTSP